MRLDKVSRSLEKWLDRLIWVSGVVSSICLAGLSLLIVIDVVRRRAFGQGVFGIIDLVEVGTVIAAFSALSYTARAKGHVSIGFFTDRLRARVRLMLDSTMALLGGALFALITWQLGLHGYDEMLKSFRAETASLHIPLFPFWFWASFGSALVTLELMASLGHSIGQAARK